MTNGWSNDPPSRRALLASLGLGAAALPLLSPRRAKGATTSAAAAFPRRLVVLVSEQGVISKEFFPQGAAGPLSAVPLGQITTPLQPFASDVTIIGGLDQRAFSDDPKRGGAAGHSAWPGILTGAYYDYFPPTDTNDIRPGRISVDQYIATELARKLALPRRSLVLSAATAYGDSSISVRGPSQLYWPENDPVKVFRALFGQRDASDLADRVRRKSVLDTVSKQITTFRSRLGTEDQSKVQLHFDAVRELERRLDTPAAACKVEPLTGAPPARDAGALPALIRAQMDNIVTAFRCDVTRVATLALGARGAGLGNIRSSWPGISPLVFPNGEIERSHHIDITHNHNNAPEKLMVENWVMQQVAYLIGQLKATPEPGGAGRTMLDNTVVLYMNTMGNGAAHSVKPLPCFIAGSCGGYFKTGRYVRVGGWAKEPIDSSGPGVPHNRLLVALANAMLVGVTTETPLPFFGEARYGGELTELRG